MSVSVVFDARGLIDALYSLEQAFPRRSHDGDVVIGGPVGYYPGDVVVFDEFLID